MNENSEYLVEVSGLKKKFSKNFKRSLVYGLVDSIRVIFGMSRQTKKIRKSEFLAVQNVSFKLKKGECLGLIGHNGAGKSTLLKILNGLIAPDGGEVVMRGRVCALIELGAGFNPILTGLENIYINGQVLGFTRKEIDAKLDDIIEFSELGDFINTPVQNYSSGMKVRLGFAIAAQMEPDVLIIDEVLAVGDLGFKLKCLNTIDNLMKTSAVIFVSHSMPMISRVCTSILLMERGKEKYLGQDVSQGVQLYYSDFNDDSQVLYESSDAHCVIKSIEVVNANESHEGSPVVMWGGEIEIFLEFELTREDESNPHVFFVIFDKEQRPIAMVRGATISPSERGTSNDRNTQRFKVVCRLPKVELSQGTYSLNMILTGEDMKNPFFRMNNALVFHVKAERDIWQPFELSAEWEIK